MNQDNAAPDTGAADDIRAVAGEFFGREEFNTAEQQQQSASQQQQEAEASRQALAGAIAGGLAITFSLLERRRGDHWKLTAAESMEAGEAYADVIEKHFPGVGGGVEVTAILITAGLIGPRLLIDKMQATEAEEAQAAAEREERGSGTQSE